MKLCATFLVFASVVAACFAAGIVSIKSDIQQTSVHVKALDDAINKIQPNGGTLQQGIARRFRTPFELDPSRADNVSIGRYTGDPVQCF